MKFLLEDVKEKLKVLGGVTAKSKNLADNMDGVLFDGRSFTASNGFVTLMAKSSLESEEKFVIPDNAVKLILTLPYQFVDINGKDNKVVVKYGKGKSNFATCKADDFYNPEVIKTGDKIEFNGKEFKDAIKSVVYACADSTIGKPIYNGVQIVKTAESNECKFNAVDGFRTAMASIPFASDCEFSMIVPKDTLLLVANLIKDDELVTISSAKNSCVIEVGDYTLNSKLYEGEFMDVNKVIPDCDVEFALDKHEALSTLARYGIVCDVKNAVVVELEEKSDELTFKGVSGSVEFDEKVTMDRLATKSLTLGFNPKYLIDAIKSFDDDEICVSLKSVTTPMIISSEKQKSVILPVRLRK